MLTNHIKVDARGVSCPQPVLMAKQAIAGNPFLVEICVDNSTARGNVERFLKSAGYTVETINNSYEFIITARK